MHLWPSLSIRDSFKHAYVKTLDRNLARMKSDKESRRRQGRERLLGDAGDEEDVEPNRGWCGKRGLRFVWGWCCELTLIVSCCYCCFGCGACIESDN